MRRILTVCIVLVLLVVFLLDARQIPRVVAADGDAEVTLLEPKADFPNGISFEAEINASHPIQNVEFVYKAELDSCTEFFAIAYPSFEQVVRTKATWYWDMKKSGGLPIGTQLLYYWQITDDTGHVTRTETQEYEWRNRDLQWKNIGNDNLEINWIKGDDAFGQLMLDEAQSALTKNQTFFGLAPHKKYRIFVYPDNELFQKDQLYESNWTAGLSYTNAGVVAVGINPDDEEEMKWGKGAMVHELTHAVFAQKEFTCIGSFPTWLVEGTAMYVEDMLHPLGEQNKSYLDYIATNGVISVRRMNDGFGVDPEQVQLMYTQSYYLVKYLVDTYGPEKFIALQQSIQDGEKADQVIQTIYGLSLEQLETNLATSLNTTSKNAVMTPTSQVIPTYIPTIVPIGAVGISDSIPTEGSNSWIYWSIGIVCLLVIVGSGLFRRAGSKTNPTSETNEQSEES